MYRPLGYADVMAGDPSDGPRAHGAAVDHLAARVFLRPLGSPLPVGLAGLAVASLLLSGLDLGWVSVTECKHVGALLLVTAVPLQAVALGFALLARDGAAATGMGVLATSWAAIGVAHLLSPAGSTSKALGLVLLAVGALLLGAGGAQAIGKPLPGLAVVLAAARFVLTAIYQLTSVEGWQNVSGVAGLVVLAVAVYLVWALQLEDTKNRPILPTARRADAAAALAGRTREQLAGVEHEAGVRRQL